MLRDGLIKKRLKNVAPVTRRPLKAEVTAVADKNALLAMSLILS
jgi:hypothetical protein